MTEYNDVEAANNGGGGGGGMKTLELGQKCASFFDTTCGIVCSLIFTFTVPFLVIAVGYIYRNDCPSNAKIPTWLVVFGVTMVGERLIGLFITAMKKRAEKRHPASDNETDEEAEARRTQIAADIPGFVGLLGIAQIVLGIFSLVWMFFGFLWVLGTFGDKEVCHWAPYTLAFVFAFAGFMVACMALCCLGCVCCVINIVTKD
ncbi:unnamed protein product [Caenorhabditis bovis]|uniref:Uncharacterized protein n=1 Tax=Caenorhabditis bovis TaxID=2654633 RepID=A0A8S1ECP5_9PELO|nr:unnamed protein product [Caenorhabditis bovis]